ncbi:MAG: sugar phosphate nucleotidyltransferase [Alphaproteobacteria bacterium]
MKTTNLHFVVLVAGSSTRNYPHSKGLPHKALLPFGDFKVIDQIMKNLVDAGGRKFTFVISSKEQIGIFDKCFSEEKQIEEKFKRSNKPHLIRLLKKCYLPKNATLNYIVQEKALGTAHAVALAAKDNENVAMILPDDIILSKGITPYQRAIQEYEKTNQGNIILTRTVQDPHRWGIVENGKYIEKPKTSISNQSGISMFIFDKKVVAHFKEAVKKMNAGERAEGLVGKELAFAHALNIEIEKDEAQKIRPIPLSNTDTYLDCGSIEGYEKALLYTLINYSYFKDENRTWITQLLKN